MNNTGIILTLAYPDTIVSHADEWYSPYLKYIGIGSKTNVRAGHAALVLINKKTGVLEYHDFGRYITPEPNGRVRGVNTDNELEIPIKAIIENNKIVNIEAVLRFFATQPKLTHGDGKLVASICDVINYDKARAYITTMQNKHSIRYAAFLKEASNCARFVTDSLIASINDTILKQKLIKSKWFTPSTVGNVLLANTGDYPFEISQEGVISEFKGTQRSENLRCFLDRLKGYESSFEGTLQSKKVEGLSEKAQWLSGIGAGAWYEIFKTENLNEYRYSRISPYGNIDCDVLFVVEESGFNIDEKYQFVYYSNCSFFNIEQNGKVFKFNRKKEDEKLALVN